MSEGPAAQGGGRGSGASRFAHQRGVAAGSGLCPAGGWRGGSPGRTPAGRPTNPPAFAHPGTSSGTFLIFVYKTVIFEVKLIFLKAQELSGG